jgi:16S rRNA (adenine1518-N6/adenine1519-N6)-dimethyltransferase
MDENRNARRNAEKREKFAKKSLGQNFLVDKNAIGKIVNSIPQPCAALLEIGPGRGALTTELYPKAEKFFVLEKDDLFAEKIPGTLFIHGSRNHEVFHADALEFDFAKIFSLLGPDSDLMVASNLPYNVATEILFRLLGFWQRIPFMALMFQKEVGQRIAAPAGGKNYGGISVLVQNFYSVKIQQILKPGAFRPSPKIDSIVLEFHRLPAPQIDFASPEEYHHFRSLVRASFSHRRKTLANSLAMELHQMGWVKVDSPTALARAGIDGKRRAETLSVVEFGNLYRAFANP